MSAAVRFRLLCTVFLMWALLGVAPFALALDAPQGKVILTVTGPIANANAGDKAVFDMAMLMALPQKTVVTKTPWYPNAVSFKGPLLRDVLAAVGAGKAKVLEARAINDYKVSIPIEDAANTDVILALTLDGKPMSVREKGPIFVIYPLNDLSASKMEQYVQRSIWQLASIKID
jgi:hypothetical protein